MKVYRAEAGLVVRTRDGWFRGRGVSFDDVFRESDPLAFLTSRARENGVESLVVPGPPLQSQEVWAAGVTYYRSREARMEESEKEADVYDRVYTAERPELFFKATPHRVVGAGGEVRIRKDSAWNVPEPELALAVNRDGRIFGYTIGNDMSSRSIEGENPLYLPQAKVYDGSCALGPCLLVSESPFAHKTEISIRIRRGGAEAFAGSTRLQQLKRSPEDLVSYLFRESSFPNGCYLLTGTGIVPPSGFTLAPGDEIEIEIAPIGTLVNKVA
jgi:2-dehydro-3-deoxy-D-arabinonate dehydratase